MNQAFELLNSLGIDTTDPSEDDFVEDSSQGFFTEIGKAESTGEFFRFEFENANLTQILYQIDEEDAWIGTPNPGSHDFELGQFWFTRMGWENSGQKILNALIKHSVDFEIKTKSALTTIYRDSIQVSEIPN